MDRLHQRLLLDLNCLLLDLNCLLLDLNCLLLDLNCLLLDLKFVSVESRYLMQQHSTSSSASCTENMEFEFHK